MDVTSSATSRPQDACVSDSNAAVLDAEVTGLVQLGAGGNAIAHHEEVETFLAVLLVNGGDEHAARVDAHHLARGQVGDRDERLVHQILGLVIPVNAGEDHAVSARAVIEHEAQELLALLHGVALLDLHNAEIRPAEGLEVDKVLEQRLDLHLGEVDGRDLGSSGKLCGLGLGGTVLGTRLGLHVRGRRGWTAGW